jgi:hypothetical protein
LELTLPLHHLLWTEFVELIPPSVVLWKPYMCIIQTSNWKKGFNIWYQSSGTIYKGSSLLEFLCTSVFARQSRIFRFHSRLGVVAVSGAKVLIPEIDDSWFNNHSLVPWPVYVRDRFIWSYGVWFASFTAVFQSFFWFI